MPRAPRLPADEARTQILRAFADRARVSGIRSIVMSDLAKALGISTKTLYQHFPTKEELVEALIDRWAARLTDEGDPVSHPKEPDLRVMIRGWVDSWARNDAQISHAFWTDLETDYPRLYVRYRGAVVARTEPIKRLGKPLLRRSLSAKFAYALYDAIIDVATDPEFAERAGMTRKQALMKAIEVWASGAIDPKALAALGSEAKGPRP